MDRITPTTLSSSDRRSLAESIYCEHVQSVGEDAVSLDALCGEHPTLADEFRVLHAALKRARRALPAPEGATGSTPSLPATTDASSSSSSAVGRYVVRGAVAEGGMGQILSVWDTNLLRPLAMKVLREPHGNPVLRDLRRERHRARLTEEAFILGQMDHPGVIPVFEVGADAAGSPFFTMRLVQGKSLREILDASSRGDAEWRRSRVLDVVIRVCETIAYAHSRGIVHRDLKPDNIMVGRFGETYVMDWGLAKALGRTSDRDVRLRATAVAGSSEKGRARSESGPPLDFEAPLLTMDGDVVGTPAYMPPEQAAGRLAEVTTSADVYSLGAMLYHVIAGHPPYCEAGRPLAPLAVLEAVLSGPPARILSLAPGTPAELVAIAEKAMKRDPARRYSSALEMAEDLRAHLEDRVVRAHRTGVLAEVRKLYSRHRRAMTAITVLVAGIAALLFLQIAASQRTEGLNKELIATNERLEGLMTEGELLRGQAEARASELEKESYFNKIALAADALRAGEINRVVNLLESCPPHQRNWEWAYLRRASDTTDKRLQVGDAIRWTNFSDDRCLVTMGSAGRLRAVDTFTGASRVEAVLPNTASGTVLTADARTLVTWNSDRFLHRWNGALGNWEKRLSGYRDARLSPDGRSCVARAWDGKKVALVDLERFEVVRELSPLPAPATCADFSADARFIHVGFSDGALRKYDAATGELVAELPRHPKSVMGVSPSPSGDGCLSWSLGEIRHDVSGVAPSILVIPAEGLFEVHPSRDGSRLVARTRPIELDVYETQGLSLTCKLRGGSQEYLSVALSADGRAAAASTPAGASLLYWIDNPDRQESGPRLSDHVFPLAWSPDGSRVLVPNRSSKLEIVDRATKTVAASHPLEDSPRGVAMSRDGRFIACGSASGKLRLYDAATGRKLGDRRAARPNEQIYRVEFHPTDDFVVTAGWDGVLSLLEVPSLRIVWTRNIHPGGLDWVKGIRGLDILENGSAIVTAGADGVARLTGMAGEPLADVRLPEHRLQGLCVSRDGRRALVGTRNGRSFLIDFETKSVLWEAAGAYWPLFSKDESRVFAVATSSLLVLDAQSGRTIVSLAEPTHALLDHIALSPDGHTIVGARSQRNQAELRFWDASPWVGTWPPK